MSSIVLTPTSGWNNHLLRVDTSASVTGRLASSYHSTLVATAKAWAPQGFSKFCYFLPRAYVDTSRANAHQGKYRSPIQALALQIKLSMASGDCTTQTHAHPLVRHHYHHTLHLITYSSPPPP